MFTVKNMLCMDQTVCVIQSNRHDPDPRKKLFGFELGDLDLKSFSQRCIHGDLGGVSGPDMEVTPINISYLPIPWANHGPYGSPSEPLKGVRLVAMSFTEIFDRKGLFTSWFKEPTGF